MFLLFGFLWISASSRSPRAGRHIIGCVLTWQYDICDYYNKLWHERRVMAKTVLKPGILGESVVEVEVIVVRRRCVQNMRVLGTLSTGKMSKWKIAPLRSSITTHSYPRGPKAQPQLQGSWPIAKHGWIQIWKSKSGRGRNKQKRRTEQTKWNEY